MAETEEAKMEEVKPIFFEDFDVRGSLYGVTIRSPIPRGRLLSVEAPRLPNSYTLIRATDIPGKNRAGDLPVPVLAEETVSYIGEPVALLLGPDKAKLDEYLSQCTVKTESETAVFGNHSFPPEAVMTRRDIHIGDTEKAFGEAQTIIEGTYTTGIQDHWYSEPAGAAAVFVPPSPEENSLPGRLVIHTATQWPFRVKWAVAGLLNIPQETVVVAPSRIGIHLDGKIWYPTLPACHAALGAFITKKPVKILFTREEDFRYTPKRFAAEIRIRSALGEQGRLLASEIQVTADLGAQGVFTDEILDRTCLGALGAYKQGAISIDGKAIVTNIPPGGPLAGFGLAQGFFAAERQVSRIADTLRQDPVEWRKNNVFHKNKTLAFGSAVADPIPLEEVLDTAAAMGDYRRKWASFELLREYRRKEKGIDKNEPLRGIGIATAYQGNGFLYSGVDKGYYGVELTLDKDGSLEIRTSMVSSNQEYTYIWRQIAGEILGVEASAVRVVSQTTEGIPDSGPSCLSRNITVITKLVERACLAIRKQRFRDPLPITVRRVYHPVKALNWEGKAFDQNALTHPGWAAAVVEVEIDPIEYTPKIRGAWIGVDGGKILSEARARRSLKFSVIQALGWASREKISYEEGIIPDSQIYNYPIPAPEDIPPIRVDFIWSDTTNPRGIGELPFSCVPAAYVQAVSQAMDHPFDRIPLTARDIWEAGKLKNAEEEQ
jgi:CO/xanthine dehydrogenase Mo-binding subunit